MEVIMELLSLLILLLILAPILAIVFGVLYSRKSAALRRFADRLYRAGRVTREEYAEAVGASPFDAPSATETVGGEPNPAAKTTVIAAPAAPRLAPAAPRRVNAVPLILALGVVLICTAGIVFVTSNWNTLSDGAKIGVIALGAVVFFAAFALARFKLELDGTGRAFYILGCAALACAVLAAIFLGVLPLGKSLGAMSSLPFTALTLGALGGYRLYRDKLFLALTWILAYVSVNLLSLWFFADALRFPRGSAVGYGELFSVIPVCVTALGMLCAFVFRAERFRDKFHTRLAFSAFCLSALLTVAVSAAYGHSGYIDRTALAFSLLVIAVTLAVTAKKSDLRFLFPLQSAAAMWTAHAVSGVALYNSVWRAALDAALMLAAFLWSRYNIKRDDKPSFIAHNLIFPLSVWLAVSSAELGVKEFSAPLTAALALTALAYIALTVTEPRRYAQWAFAAFAAIFSAAAFIWVSDSSFPEDPVYVVFAVACAIIAFARVPKYEHSASVQRVLAFAMSLFAVSQIAEERLLWRSLFVGFCAVAALADALACKDDARRRGVSGVAVYGFTLWLIAYVMMWFGFRRYGGWFDLHKTWPDSLWLDLIRTVLYAVTTAVLVIESRIFRARGAGTRLTFVVAVFANSIFAAVQSAPLLFDFNSLAENLRVIYSVSAIVFGAVGCFVIYRRERTFADVLPALAFWAGLWRVAGVSGGGEARRLAAILICAAGCAIYGFILGGKRRGYANLRAVWIISCAVLMVSGFAFDPHRLIRLGGAFLLSLNLLQYLRTRGKDATDRALITAASAFACVALAIWTGTLSAAARLFVTAQSELVAVILVVGAFLIARRLWRFNSASHWAAFIVSVFCAALVYFGAADNRILHIAVVTAAALAALGASLPLKRGRWFAFGFAAVAVIFFRETSEFWLNLKWWVYLLAVGLTLVTVAAVNEAGRRRGAGIAYQLKRSKIREWNW
jgi:hypothetical protein